MIDLAEYNSRMKDFYDVYTILVKYGSSLKNLEEAVIKTFEKRNTKTIGDHTLFSSDFYRDRDRIIQWKAFLSKANVQADLDFSIVMKTIKNAMEPIYNRLVEHNKENLPKDG